MSNSMTQTADAVSESMAPRATVPMIRDLIELAKPRITMLATFTAGVGLWMAPGSLGPLRTAVFLLAATALIASANTLNCWVEREIDGRMQRTRKRPLPAGRLNPRIALAAGVLEAIAALGLLAATTNPLTVGLGAAALVIYVGVYTPLKRVSWWAVVVGAVPGAIPPMMGWTAGTGTLSAAGWTLFGILFFWQLPHFIAISLYLKDDYQRGGLKVLPLVRGDVIARRHLFAYTILLVLVSLIASPLGMAGPTYFVTASLLGAGFLYLAAGGLRRTVGARWARHTFAYSIVYLSVLIGVLVLDAL